jgi:hypothetical protein
MDQPSGSVPEQVRQFAPKPRAKPNPNPPAKPRRDGPSDELLGILQQIAGMSNEQHERPNVPAPRLAQQPSSAIPDQGQKPAPQRPPADDTIEQAGQALIGMLQKAAGATNEEYEQATILAGRVAAELRVTESRIKQLEAEVSHFRDRAAKAEGWLQHISHVIEEQLIAPQAAPRKGAPETR